MRCLNESPVEELRPLDAVSSRLAIHLIYIVDRMGPITYTEILSRFPFPQRFLHKKLL